MHGSKFAMAIVSVCVWLAAGCTDDFSRYKFTAQSGHDGGVRSGGAGVDAQAANEQLDAQMPAEGAGVGGGTSNPDASVQQPHDAGPQNSGGRTAMPPHAGKPSQQLPDDVDAQTPDRDAEVVGVDAGPPSDEVMCREALETLGEQTSACSECSCQACLEPALDCLVRGDDGARARCAAVWSCAVRSGCHDWDCYCESARCLNTPSADGDGPCAVEMNAAAGGGRAQVNDAHFDHDLGTPLMRAVEARGCTVGIPPPGPGMGEEIQPMCRGVCTSPSAE